VPPSRHDPVAIIGASGALGFGLALRLGRAGIPIENSKGEWGPGQEEINVRYADALEMADRHVLLKNGIKEIAWAHGKCVTFMAKWNYALAGSSAQKRFTCAAFSTSRPRHA